MKEIMKQKLIFLLVIITIFSIPSYANEPMIAYWKNDVGFCAVATTWGKDDPQAMIDDIEGKSGKRVSGYKVFNNGVIVEFKTGGRVAAWFKEIDCKDPPYDPLAREIEKNVSKKTAYFEAKNKSGGIIILEAEYGNNQCLFTSPMHVTTKSGEVFRGCWAYRDGMIHVVDKSGKKYTYNPKDFLFFRDGKLVSK